MSLHRISLHSVFPCEAPVVSFNFFFFFSSNFRERDQLQEYSGGKKRENNNAFLSNTLLGNLVSLRIVVNIAILASSTLAQADLRSFSFRQEKKHGGNGLLEGQPDLFPIPEIKTLQNKIPWKISSRLYSVEKLWSSSKTTAEGYRGKKSKNLPSLRS